MLRATEELIPIVASKAIAVQVSLDRTRFIALLAGPRKD
jgi:hypothetical protein